jgi:hypothetical protein
LSRTRLTDTGTQSLALLLVAPSTRQAHNEYVLAEKRREEWELRNHREGEISEMVSQLLHYLEG